MCNINVLVKVGKGEKLFSPFVASVENSFRTNNDGDGVYFSYNNTVVKSVKKIDLIDYREIFMKSDFIVSHQRLATSGLVNEDMAHPFTNNEIVLVHNGVLDNMGNETKSDTAVFFEKLWKNFKRYKDRFSRSEAMIKAIQKTTKKSSGSLSIAVYDKIARKLYYFKNSGTTIKNVAGEIDGTKFLFLTTSFTNIDFFSMRMKEMIEYDIRNNRIYEISIENGAISVNDVGEFETKYEYRYYGGYYGGYYSNSQGSHKHYEYDDIGDWVWDSENNKWVKANEPESKTEPLVYLSEPRACDTCERDMKYIAYDFDGKLVCEWCYIEESDKVYSHIG